MNSNLIRRYEIPPHRLSRSEALLLWHKAPLSALGAQAHEMRLKKVPNLVNGIPQVTFLIDRNINYTNVCNTDCSFCAFYRHESNHADAYVNTREILEAKISEALENGATRILFQGGHNDSLPYSYYPETIAWIHSRFPSIEINAFSPSEINQMKKKSGKEYREILSELKSVGMRGLPGGGAEILDDEVRARVSPKKISADEWIEVMEIAHEVELTTTATMVLGFGESIEQRFNHLDRVRALQDRSLAKGLRGFSAFISWTLQHNENTSLGRSRMRDSFGAESTEYLRNVAICRLYLDCITNHQASWPTLGTEVAKIALHFGCNDLGSTMMEENVVSQAGGPTSSKWSMTPEELVRAIKESGFIPAQRDTSYNVIKVF